LKIAPQIPDKKTRKNATARGAPAASSSGTAPIRKTRRMSHQSIARRAPSASAIAPPNNEKSA
jgi:hypothetical protein